MGLGEELGAECRNSARRCGGFDLREPDACQAQPETAAGCLVQILSVPRRRGPSSGAVMSAREGAVKDVQELRGRGVGVVGGGGGGGRSDLS